MNQQEFIEALNKMQIPISETQLQQFKDYATLLIEYNEKVNLTAITKWEEVYEKHFFDCIQACKCVEMQGALCDVGAGAGFPSIPLKIMFPDLRVTILEPLQKRVVFLNLLCKTLGIEVDVQNVRAEEYAIEHRESFDIVTARAVANLRMLSELCIPLVKMNGIFLTLKGANAHLELDEAKKAIGTLGCSFEKEYTYQLSDQVNRINLIFRKVKPTDKRYPRMFSKIKKNPL